MPYAIVDAGSLYYSAYDMGTLSVPVQVGGAVGGSDPVDLFKVSLSGLSDRQINLSGLLPGQDVDLSVDAAGIGDFFYDLEVSEATPTLSRVDFQSPSYAAAEEGGGTVDHIVTLVRDGYTSGTSIVEWYVTLDGLNPLSLAEFGGSLPPQFTVSAVCGNYDVRAIRRLVRRVVPQPGRYLRRRAAGLRRRHAVERAAEFQYWRIRRHPHRAGGGRLGNRADGKLFFVSLECLERYNWRFEHRLWFDRERRHGY